MAWETTSAHLRYILEERGERVHKPKSTVLFRHGDKVCQPLLVILGEKVADNHDIERAWLEA